MRASETPIRNLPEAIARTTCEGCGQPIVWATTVAGPNGPGGKLMPLDPVEHVEGNVAVTNPHRGTLRARVLARGETFSRPLEYAAMPHFATCFARTHPQIPDEVVDLQAERTRRRGRRR